MKIPKSKLTKYQEKTYEGVTKEGHKVTAFVRYGDDCGNNHNPFGVTGTEYEKDKPQIERFIISCGCIHDKVTEAIPELLPYVKWHLCSSDEPMHYIANTLYYARDRTHKGVPIGDPVKWSTELKFKGMPFSFREPHKDFWDYLKNIKDFSKVEVVEVLYIPESPEDHVYTPNYILTDFMPKPTAQQWHVTPFNNKQEAEEFLEALQNFEYGFTKTPTDYCKAVEPNLEAARRCAIWEGATLEQLQDEEQLKARLPALMEEFKEAMESLGFIY